MNHYIGAHLSSATGFYKMGRTALEIGANTFQFFCRNPRGAKAKPLDPPDLEKLRGLLAEGGGERSFFVSDYVENFSQIAEIFLGCNILSDVQRIDIEKY